MYLSVCISGPVEKADGSQTSSDKYNHYVTLSPVDTSRLVHLVSIFDVSQIVLSPAP